MLGGMGELVGEELAELEPSSSAGDSPVGEMSWMEAGDSCLAGPLSRNFIEGRFEVDVLVGLLDSGKCRVTKSEIGIPSLPKRIVWVSNITKRPPAGQSTE